MTLTGLEGTDLEVRALTRRYPGVVALSEVDLTARGGTVHGLVGPNGAGKSTLMAVLLGLVRADRGEVTLGGVPLADLARRVPGGVAGSVEQPRCYPYLTTRQNLEVLGRLDADGGLTPDEALSQVGLLDQADQKAAHLSMGMRQRLSIAAALLRRPALLVLDEPTSGLDPESSAALLQRIAVLAGEGRTILFSSHDLALVADVCDDVSIMASGRLVRSASVAELVAEAPVGVYRLRTGDDLRAFQVLRGVVGAHVERGRPGLGLLLAADQRGLDRTLARLVTSGISLQELVSERAPLRLLYERLTKRPPEAA